MTTLKRSASCDDVPKAEKKNWFERLKRFFSSETKPKQEKKERRKSWLSGPLKSRYPPLLPASSLQEAEETENRHAVAIAVATAEAAEADVSTVRLTRAQEVAAIKIQSAFRGLLARRALRALKGLVKLQALIRGQAVRHQATITLKGLQSLMKIQSQACASRVRAAEDHRAGEDNNMVYAKAKGLTLQQNINRGWDSSTLSKEEIIALLNNRREAAMKRERAMEYAFSHQERRRSMTPVSKEYEPNVRDRSWSWLNQWADAQPLDNNIPEVFSTSCRDQKTKEKVEETQLGYLGRRSFNKSQRTSLKDDDLFSSSPSFLSYEASTAFANARFRSLSTPKQRKRTIESYSEYCSPCNDRVLSPFPSNASDIGLSKNSNRSLKYNVDSECSLLNWDHHSSLNAD